jgi:hypothetical protein
MTKRSSAGRAANRIAVFVTIAFAACTPAADVRDVHAQAASLDSASASGRTLIWRAHGCLQRTKAARSDTMYPATDSSLRADSACRSLPLDAKSADGWQLAYRRTGDTAGYELRARRDARDVRPISLYSRVLPGELGGDNGTIHAREGDSTATWSDPVVGSPLPMIVWIGWCLDQNQTTRDSGIEGYRLHLLPFGPGGLACLGTPPFHFTADSDVVIVKSNGLEYAVKYEVGYLEGESLRELGPDGEMRTILEWRYNTDYSMTATPVRYGETGIRSYFIEPNGGMARPWITPDRPQVDRSILAVPLEAPMCDWIRGRRCDPPRPNPNDGGFGPGLLTILHADMYKVH